MMLAALMIFHKNGNAGIPDLHEFFEMNDLSIFVGSSISALQKISKTIDQKIIAFNAEEVKNLAENMPPRSIPGAVDENFIMDDMVLILMDPVSGYILAEEIEEKRDAETWCRVTQAALNGLNVTIQQLVGDEAAGLIKLATHGLKVVKGSDLFHIQQEITKGLTSPLARAVQQAKKKQEDLQKDKSKILKSFGEQLEGVKSVEELSKKGVSRGKRIIEIMKEEKVSQQKIAIAENRYKLAQEARRGITLAYHPFDLDTGKKQSPEAVKAKLEECYATLEKIAEEADCTDKQKKRLERSKGLIGSMIEILAFFFSFLALTMESMRLSESEVKLFEKIASIEYLKICLQKATKRNQKEKIKITVQRLEKEVENHVLWNQMGEAIQEEWRYKALESAHVFQRSSSCVEGRNGQLSLKFHAFRRISTRSLQVLTVLHNFFIKKADGSTAGERFFKQKPRDLFTWLLDKVELPRPRKKHKRQASELRK